MKKKLNIIDIAIIAAAILVIAAVAYRAVIIENSGVKNDEKTITYTVTVPKLDSVYSDSAKTGDIVFTGNSVNCGKIVSVNSSYASEDVVFADGTVENHICPSEINLKLTVELTARTSDGKIYIEKNSYIADGERVDFYTETFSFSGIVSEITQN